MCAGTPARRTPEKEARATTGRREKYMWYCYCIVIVYGIDIDVIVLFGLCQRRCRSGDYEEEEEGDSVAEEENLSQSRIQGATLMRKMRFFCWSVNR